MKRIGNKKGELLSSKIAYSGASVAFDVGEGSIWKVKNELKGMLRLVRRFGKI